MAIVAELAAVLGLDIRSGEWAKGHEMIQSLHHAVEAYIGVEALKKVGELIQGTVEAAVQAKHLGERLGITGEAVQELGYAADITGASAEDMTMGMQRLALGLEHAKKGTGPLVDAMSQLHVPIKNLRNEKLDQNLEEIADGFANAGPHVDRLALSIEIFGRNAGPKLLPLLNKGSAGIKELREEAQKLGVVIDEEGIQKAEEFEISQKKLGATLKGLRNEAVIAILPALQEMAEGLQKWVAENREAIASTLKSVLEGIATAFKVVGTIIKSVTEFFQEHLEVAKFVLITLGALITAFAVEAAIDWLIAFWPIPLIVAAVIGTIYWIKFLWETIQKGVRAAGAAWDWIKGKAKEFDDWLGGLPSRALGWLEDLAQSIKDAFQDAFDWVVRKATEMWEDIKDNPIVATLAGGGRFTGPAVAGAAGGEGAMTWVQAALRPETSVSGGGDGAPASASIDNVQQTFQIDAFGMSPEELKKAMKDSTQEGLQDALRLAMNNVSGGKR